MAGCGHPANQEIRMDVQLVNRTVFSQAFLKDLAEVWSDDGREAMVKTANINPTVFFATCARLIPNDVRVTSSSSFPAT